MLMRPLFLVIALVVLPLTFPNIVIAGQPTLNHAPVAKNQSVKVAEDTAKAIRLKASDSDKDPLTYTIISGPTQGMLTGLPPTVTYTPNPNYYGPDSFTFSVNDGTVDGDVATVSITVTPVNDAPAALSQDMTAFENVPLAITLSGTDVDGNPLSYKIVSRPSHGRLAGTGANQTYTPNADYRGPDSFTFRVTDGKKNSNAAVVSINVRAINHAPVAQEQHVTTEEDVTRTITLVATDVDGDTLTYQIVASPAHGRLTGNPPNMTYTPAANYHGLDSFTFKASDGRLESNVGTVSITVTQINHPPLALNINSPQDGATLNSSPVAVTGTVSNMANVTVNGIQASPGNGSFSVSVPLTEGLNTITAMAADPYGQTASQSINVSLITRGDITGTVTDTSTNLALPAATISITDSSNVTRTALTDNNGTYAITGIPSGAFAGSMTKGGYAPFNFTGSMSPGESMVINGALIPVIPVITNITVSGVTTNSATITWTTDQSTDSYVAYGTTITYGNWVTDSPLTTSHTITLTNLSPGTVYHYRVTSTNAYGFSSSSGDLVFETQRPALTLVITSPTNGAQINRPDIMVRGTVINLRGNETGVTVNGKVAMVAGSEFVANHIPLAGGANIILATATDTEENTVNTSIIVNADTTGEFVSITANTESGISPLEVMLTVDSSLDLTNASLTHTGPGEVEFLSTTMTEYRVRLREEGIYYFTVSLSSGGTGYEDALAVVVVSKTDIEGLLRAKWEAMKRALRAGDTETSLNYFVAGARDQYRQIFTALITEEINSIFSDLEFELETLTGRLGECGVVRIEEGEAYSYPVTFVQDENGIWRIMGF